MTTANLGTALSAVNGALLGQHRYPLGTVLVLTAGGELLMQYLSRQHPGSIGPNAPKETAQSALDVGAAVLAWYLFGGVASRPAAR